MGKALKELESRYEQLLNQGYTTFTSDEVNNLVWSIWNLRMEMEVNNENKRAS